MRKLVAFLTVAAAAAIPAAAQNQRRATFAGVGGGDNGKCTVEVVVDGAADIEIRGDTGYIRNLSGQPAQWRRFECTGPIPRNPANFQFHGVDGRGRQQLVSDPRNNGVAVVRIEDPQGGQQGYTFDLTWSGGGYPTGGYTSGGYPSDRPGWYGNRDRGDRRYSTQQAIDMCQDAVRQEAAQRYGARDVRFRGAQLDDNPNRRDWIVGSVDLRNRGREEPYQFSCAMNFGSGQVRSVRLEPGLNQDYGYSGRYGSGDRQDTPNSVALERCQSAVQDRIQRSGYGRVDFGSIRMEDNAGRRDQIVGEARASRGNGYAESFAFRCSVDMKDGDLRSVDVDRR